MGQISKQTDYHPLKQKQPKILTRESQPSHIGNSMEGLASQFILQKNIILGNVQFGSLYLFYKA